MRKSTHVCTQQWVGSVWTLHSVRSSLFFFLFRCVNLKVLQVVSKYCDLTYNIWPNYRTYPYKHTVKWFSCLQIVYIYIRYFFFKKAYVVGTHLNCLNLMSTHKYISVGNPRDQWPGTRSLLLFLALHKVGFFRISLFISNGICSNKAQSMLKIKLFLMVLAYSAIWFNSQDYS